MSRFRGYRSIVGLELRRGVGSALLWSLLLFGLIVMGLAFYPAIGSSLAELEGLFSNPMMAGVLAAFGADAQSLANLTGFYVTYASIYVTLLGCVYAAIVGARSLAGDEASGLSEFLLTRPVGRLAVFAGKATTVGLFVLMMNAIVLGGSFLGLELFGASAPLTVYADERVVPQLVRAAAEEPKAFLERVAADDELFDTVAVALARREIAGAPPSELQAAGIDPRAVNDLVARLEALGPEGLIADVRQNPASYREVMGTDRSVAEIRAGADELEQELDALRAAFEAGGKPLVEMVQMVPDPFIRRLASDDAAATQSVSTEALEESLGVLGINPRLAERLLIRYPAAGIAVRSVYTVLAMLSFAGFGMLFSASSRRPEPAVGGALAVVFVTYFVDVVSSAVGAGGIAPASPFAMIATDLLNPQYGIAGVELLYFLGLAGATTVVGGFAFRRRDIHVP